MQQIIESANGTNGISRVELENASVAIFAGRYELSQLDPKKAEHVDGQTEMLMSRTMCGWICYARKRLDDDSLVAASCSTELCDNRLGLHT